MQNMAPKKTGAEREALRRVRKATDGAADLRRMLNDGVMVRAVPPARVPSPQREERRAESWRRDNASAGAHERKEKYEETVGGHERDARRRGTAGWHENDAVLRERSAGRLREGLASLDALVPVTCVGCKGLRSAEVLFLEVKSRSIKSRSIHPVLLI